MTVDQAEAISAMVPQVTASKGSTGFCRRSQLGHWSMVEISNAFSLMIAKNRLDAAADQSAKRLCKEYAEKAGALLASLRMIVIPDAEADRLSRLEQDSSEYNEARRKLVISLLEDKSPEWQRFQKLKSLESINNYCWTLDAEDPQYWPMVYAHLNLPYDDKVSPRSDSVIR